MRIITGLDELQAIAGQETSLGEWFEVSQDRINVFAEATNDRQWIHVDVERAARESPFKTTIAHGFLTLSLLPHLVNEAQRVEGLRLVVNYGVNKVRFPGPVTAGSRIRARILLAKYTALSRGADVEWQVTIEREGEIKPACIASVLVRCYQ